NATPQRSDATAKTDIAVAGRPLHTENLHAAYTPAVGATGTRETVSVTGAAGFAVSGNTVEVKLGNDGRTQGLVIQNGQLTNLDASVSADFTLLGLTVHATNLTVLYAAASGTTPQRVDVYGALGV